MKEFAMEITVSEQDVGKKGLLTWLAILGWFGAARELFLVKLIPEGIKVGDILKMTPIATCEIFARFIGEAKLGEKLVVWVGTEKIKGAATYLTFRLEDQSSRLVAEGTNSLLFVSSDGALVNVPDMLKDEALLYSLPKVQKPNFRREMKVNGKSVWAQKEWMPAIKDTNCLGDVYWLNFVCQAGRLSEESLRQAGSALTDVRSVHFQLRKQAFFGDRLRMNLSLDQSEVAAVFLNGEGEIAVSGYFEIETENKEAILAL